MTKPTTIEAYLETLEPERRTAIEAIGEVLRSVAPDATESIAYDMPAFRTADGRFVASYAAFKQHDSLFPASDAVVAALGDEVRPYVAGRGTFRFPIDRPRPLDLIRRIAEARVAELAAEPPNAGRSTRRTAAREA